MRRLRSEMTVVQTVTLLSLVIGAIRETDGWLEGHRHRGTHNHGGLYGRRGDRGGGRGDQGSSPRRVDRGEGSPLRVYDQARYEYEDRLIMGLHNPPRGHTHMTLEEHPLAQPLNNRLPVLPTRPPRFHGPSPLNLTAVLGSTVVLPCRVTDLGTASLSWVRLAAASSHLTVLSSSTFMFSSSPRLSLLHQEESPDWTLQIGPVIKEDRGLYECQANTEPKTSRVIHLSVVGAGEQVMGPGPALALQGDEDTGIRPDKIQKTSILAPSVMHPQPGDTVTLECVVTEHASPPAYFTWYIDGSALDFTDHRGGLLLQEDKRSRSSASRLTMTRLQTSDSGQYTCSPALAANASVRLDVTVREVTSYFHSGAATVTGGLALTSLLLMLLW